MLTSHGMSQRTHSLYASRPSSFGPHILHEPLAALLYPITSFAATDSYACSVNKSDAEPPFEPPKQGWVALVERGRCHFSVKVRLAQDRGAVAVVFGDQSASEGGIGRSGGLLTPWSPGECHACLQERSALTQCERRRHE